MHYHLLLFIVKKIDTPEERDQDPGAYDDPRPHEDPGLYKDPGPYENLDFFDKPRKIQELIN